MEIRYCNLIAEIGATHVGDFERAKLLIDLAIDSGADVVKFQKRNPYVSTPENLKQLPHPNADHSYGNTYLDHRLNLEFDISIHKKLKEYIENKDCVYSTSVFDMDSAIDVLSLDPDYIKIPSCMNHDYKLISFCLENYNSVHVSTGMSTLAERESLLSMLSSHKDNVVVFHCTSEYPCSFSHLYLKEIQVISDLGFECGFSNHGYGIAADVAALAFGATWIERHFIDDRAFPHTDSSASLEPRGFSTLRRDLDNVSLAVSYREKEITAEERVQRDKLRVAD